MITKQQYVEYLICTIGNYTSSHLAEHLDEASHDVVSDYLRSEHLTARGLWELVCHLIEDSQKPLCWSMTVCKTSATHGSSLKWLEFTGLQTNKLGCHHGIRVLFYFPNLARSSSITLSSNFLNSGPG